MSPPRPDSGPEPTAETEIQAVWTGVADEPVLTVNQFLCQFADADEVILTFGHVAPPVLLGSPEERLEQAREIEVLPISLVARLGLTRTKLEQLRDILVESLESYERLQSPKGRGP